MERGEKSGWMEEDQEAGWRGTGDVRGTQFKQEGETWKAHQCTRRSARPEKRHARQEIRLNKTKSSSWRDLEWEILEGGLRRDVT